MSSGGDGAGPREFIPLGIAVLTISDTRTPTDDKSGSLLVELLTGPGHRLAAREFCRDDIYAIRAIVSAWLVDPRVQVVLTTGGTGVTGRDGTPEALSVLFDKSVDGFGEMFRMLSFDEIRTSTIQSRAMAGVANGRFIFCLPGSPSACRTAWERLISEQLDFRTRPCNLVELMPRLLER